MAWGCALVSLELHGVACRESFSISVNLSAQQGECVSIVGPNGAGKSTILHTIAGLIPLCEGELLLDGAVWDSPSAKKWIDAQDRPCSVVFQDLRLFPFLSAQRNVEYGLRARGVNRRDAEQQALDALAQLDAQHLGQRHVNELSGGEQQRVALARALVVKPRVLLLDEPFAAIDLSSRVAFRQLLSDVLRQSEVISFMVSHDPADAESMATQAVSLSA